jgi:uncharacterized protein YaaW (UPF0174 family)
MAAKDRLFMLLSELDDNELANIWTQCLHMKPDDEFFTEGSKDHKVIVISKEWRAIHGHTLFNRFLNDHELPWKRILIDVADKLNPGVGWTDFRMDDERSAEEIEGRILELFDQLVKERWEKLSEKERQEMVNAINDSLDHTDEVIRAKGNRAGFAPVTVASLSSGVAVGLLSGGGALLVAQSAAVGVVGGLLGGALYQIGLWLVVRIFGWWSGAQLVIGGGAATIGAALVSTPALIAFAANALMSTSYRKTIPATLSLLCAHEMRKQLAELEKTQ